MRAALSVTLACVLGYGSVVALSPLFAAALATPRTATAPATQKTATLKADAVTLKVLDVSPSTPAITTTPAKFTVTLSATNTTDQPIAGVSISAIRGSPIGSQRTLNSALAHPSAAGDLAADIPGKAQRPQTLQPDTPSTMTFETTTSAIQGVGGLCLCAAAEIYPLLLTAHNPAGVALGSASTFMPAFDAKPEPVEVSWMWPLLDRPHRLSASTVFLDDELATSVNAGGRLDRALAVPELLPRDQPMTLLIDPDLLDELEIMATGHYRVHAGKTTVPGTGGEAAAAWLDRLRQMLADHPRMQVALTPVADPDVQALSSRGVAWSSTVPTATAARVSDALGGAAVRSDIAWPATTSIDSRTLTQLVQQGVRTLVLPTTAVTPRDGAGGATPAGLARLGRRHSTVAVALTSAVIERGVQTAISEGGAGTAALPQLVSEVAVRAAQHPDATHPLVITAPRYVNANPAVAYRTILDTTRATFARPTALATLTAAGRLPKRTAHLTKSAARSALPAGIADDVTRLAAAIPTVDSMLGQSPTAAGLLAALPVGLQRLQSSGWQLDSTVGQVSAHSLLNLVHTLLSGVRIVPPSSGQYTLASSNSELPVTVENLLAYPVQISLGAQADNNLPGFTATPLGTTIDAHSKKILHLSTVIERSGRIQIEAHLSAPDGRSLGEPVPLAVRSTALGAIGVVITIVAGAILVLALLVRAIRQLARRRARAAAAAARRRVSAPAEPAKAAR